MIPTVILIGALVRRWWVVLAVAALWPLGLVIWGDVDGGGDFVGAGLLGAINAAIGAVIGTAIWELLKGALGKRTASTSP